MLLDGETRVSGPLRTIHGLQIGQRDPALIRPAPAVPLLQNGDHAAPGVGPCLSIARARAAADVYADGRRDRVLCAHGILLVSVRLLLTAPAEDEQPRPADPFLAGCHLQAGAKCALAAP